MNRKDYITNSWEDYELIDSGNHRKLERFGTVRINRPDPQAVWPVYNSALWQDIHAEFAGTKNNNWAIAEHVSPLWHINYGGAVCNLGFGSFKHIGIFPEHRSQWDNIKIFCSKKPAVRVLNLFGYTGIASIVAAMHGAQVTHVDASKQTLATVRKNAKDSGLPEDALQCVLEDALKYVKRLVSRGEQYDLVLMDPPAFGRGPKGEVWKIEEKLFELISLIPQIVSDAPIAVILNGYAAGYSALSFGQLLEAVFEHQGIVTYGDVAIAQSNSDRVLPTGIYAQWQPKEI